MDTSVEARLQRLEAAVFGGPDGASAARPASKPVALSQLAHSTLLSNGQKKIALIVGYNEMVLGLPPMGFTQIREQWAKAKFAKKCDAKLLERAIIDGLVRDPNGDNAYDLTQDGEAFWQQVLAGQAQHK